jgi:hypothetical protein
MGKSEGTLEYGEERGEGRAHPITRSDQYSGEDCSGKLSHWK